MVSGLLMELDDHNCWTIAEAVGHRGPHRLQHLLSRAVWDDQQVLDIASAWAVSHLDDEHAVLIVDETADEKSSADAGIAMAFNLIEAAQERWRAVSVPLVALVRAGARFECGKLVERDPVLEATRDADDTPVQPPAASNQPASNAA
jgi:hypothetical protein